MIDATHNFEEGVEFLSKDLDKNIANAIPLQNNFLDSEKFNEAMQNIEKELNLLYEKTRVLEDIIAYSKEFIQQQIHVNKEKIYKKLETIEDTRDLIKDRAYVLFRAPIKERSVEVIRDRDGTVIDHCEVFNGNLTLSGQDLEEIKVVDITKKQELVSFNDNLDTAIENKFYRSYYILDGPANNGVKEEIIYLFDGVKQVNHISVTPVNCNIASISFINENGAEESAVYLQNAIVPEKKMTGVKFTLISHNYETLIYDVDMERINSDFWDIVPTYEYNRTLGKMNEYDLHKLSGIEQYEKEYEKFLDEWIEWDAEKRKHEQQRLLIEQKYADISKGG